MYDYPFVRKFYLESAYELVEGKFEDCYIIFIFHRDEASNLVIVGNN